MRKKRWFQKDHFNFVFHATAHKSGYNKFQLFPAYEIKKETKGYDYKYIDKAYYFAEGVTMPIADPEKALLYCSGSINGSMQMDLQVKFHHDLFNIGELEVMARVLREDVAPYLVELIRKLKDEPDKTP